jgi:8-oxo-dGTP diphosphatase
LFTTELIQPPLHAIELFFSVKQTGGSLYTGHDPETDFQIIKEVRFVSWSELRSWKMEALHGIFQKVDDPSKIMGLRGYFKL